MSRKHLTMTIVIGVAAIMFVLFMYSKNYIVLESKGIHIVFPADSDENHIEKSFEQPNTEVKSENTVKPKEIQPSSIENKSEVVESRFYDDVMKAVETFMPLITVLIPIYLHRKNKKKLETADA